jgi:hypothetical protein
MTVHLPLGFQWEGLKRWFREAKIRVVRGVTIHAVIIVAVPIIIVGLTVTTEAAHDSLVVTGFNGGKA